MGRRRWPGAVAQPPALYARLPAKARAAHGGHGSGARDGPGVVALGLAVVLGRRRWRLCHGKEAEVGVVGRVGNLRRGVERSVDRELWENGGRGRGRGEREEREVSAKRCAAAIAAECWWSYDNFLALVPMLLCLLSKSSRKARIT